MKKLKVDKRVWSNIWYSPVSDTYWRKETVTIKVMTCHKPCIIHDLFMNLLIYEKKVKNDSRIRNTQKVVPTCSIHSNVGLKRDTGWRRTFALGHCWFSSVGSPKTGRTNVNRKLFCFSLPSVHSNLVFSRGTILGKERRPLYIDKRTTSSQRPKRSRWFETSEVKATQV